MGRQRGRGVKEEGNMAKSTGSTPDNTQPVSAVNKPATVQQITLSHA